VPGVPANSRSLTSGAGGVRQAREGLPQSVTGGASEENPMPRTPMPIQTGRATKLTVVQSSIQPASLTSSRRSVHG
jgi:hypothetical protein